MAYPIPVGGILELTWSGIMYAQRIMTVTHWRQDTGTVTNGSGVLNTICATMRGGVFGTTYLSAMASDYTSDYVSAQYIYPGRYQRVQQAWGPSVGVGTAAGSAATAAAITRRGDTASRGSVGTLHMAGVPQSEYSAGMLSATIRLAYSNLAALLSTSNGFGTLSVWSPIIYHRAAPAMSVPITSFTVQPTVRTERRRVVGRGV